MYIYYYFNKIILKWKTKYLQKNPTIKVRVRGDKNEFVLDGINQNMTPYDVLMKLAHDPNRLTKYGQTLQKLLIDHVTFHPINYHESFEREK